MTVDAFLGYFLGFFSEVSFWVIPDIGGESGEVYTKW